MYLAKSPRYSNEIHCEAVQENDRAKQICLSLGAKTTPVDGTADSTGYDTYVLEGTGTTAGAISSGGGASGSFWNNTPVPSEALNIMKSFGEVYDFSSSEPSTWSSGVYDFAMGGSFLYDPNLRMLDSEVMYEDYGGEWQRWFFDEEGSLIGTATHDEMENTWSCNSGGTCPYTDGVRFDWDSYSFVSD